MGINSSVFSTSSWTVNGANDGYLYVAGGDLAIGTDQVSGEIKTFLGPVASPTVVSVANASTITYSVDLMPSVDAQYLLGRPGQRWKGIYVGTGSVWINDISLGTDAELTVDNGVLYVNGAYQLQVGQLKFFENTIESTTGGTDIQIGQTTSTANLVLNRNTVIATGKSLVFGTGEPQTVAWNSTATVLWNQITGVPGFATTATVNTLIANSLTNFVYTGTVKLSVATAASGTSALSFTTSTGVFTFTPPNLSAYLTTVTNVAYANTATNLVGGIGVASIAGSSGTSVSASTGAVTVWFNTGTLVTTAVTANTVAGGYVSSITAGTGTAISTSTGAVTVWALPAQAITSTGTTIASNYTLDLSGPTFVHWQPSANGNRTITLSGFTPGRKVELWITPHTTNDIFTVTGVTASQCSNGHNTFTMNGVGASQQSSFIMQFYCTTDTIGGVWIYGNGSL